MPHLFDMAANCAFIRAEMRLNYNRPKGRCNRTGKYYAYDAAKKQIHQYLGGYYGNTA